MQLVCRDRNRLALEADIMGAALHGIENLCCLTGDDVTAGDEPEARRVFDLDSVQLIALAAGMAAGRYLSGRAIEPAPELFIGAVENPGAPPYDYRVRRAAKKALAGARYLQLQLCFEPERLEAFMARRRRARPRRAGRDHPERDHRPRRRRAAVHRRARARHRRARRHDRARAPPPTTSCRSARTSPSSSPATPCRCPAWPASTSSHSAETRASPVCASASASLPARSASLLETVLSSRHKTVVIGPERPFCIIGERINPTGRKAFQAQLQANDISQLDIDIAEQLALAGGADMLDVNVGDPLADEVDLMRQAVLRAQELTDLPLCIDSSVVEALEAGPVGLRGQGAGQLRHRRGRAARADPADRRQVRRGRDRPGERRRDPDGSRAPGRDRAQDREGRRRLRHPARGHRDRRAGDADRRRAARRGAVLRDPEAAPRASSA